MTVESLSGGYLYVSKNAKVSALQAADHVGSA